ncbi:MAG: stage III sporulation protein AF [Syntrophomonas sp.]
MAVLEEIVRNLLVIVIIASFIELLVPDGNIKPFVRFAIGLFILITILHPTLTFLFDDRSFKVDLWDYQVKNLKQGEILENGKKINQQINESNNSVMKDKLEGQISAMTMLVPGVDDVEIKAELKEDGSISKLNLMVRPDKGTTEEANEHVKVFSGNQNDISQKEQQQIRNKIISVINNLYGFENVDIDINFEGG